jgi:hypothetical protein
VGNCTRCRRGRYRRELVQLPLAHGADPNSQEEGGRTLLDLASEEGHLEVVQVVTGSRANVHVRDNQGLTPFQVASRIRESLRGGHGIIARARRGENIAFSCPRLYVGQRPRSVSATHIEVTLIPRTSRHGDFSDTMTRVKRARCWWREMQSGLFILCAMEGRQLHGQSPSLQASP